ncbi:MAG TPA: hypothetical protein VN605_07825, partial [Thermoanaerobaculia bacterium]|nr:hypothetical protein [Thermoanaerobaculia bacterium]
MLLLGCLTAGSAVAADVDLSGFDKVLLPLDPTIQLNGANGTSFETALRIAPPASIRFYPTGVNTDATSIGAFEAGLHSDPIAPQAPSSSSGRLLFIEKGKIDDLHLQFWLKTRPAGAQEHESLWTSIPVVRERDFRTGSVVFAQVPSLWVYLDPQEVIGHPLAQFRYLLRLYDVDNRGDVELRVRFEELAFLTPTLLSERIVKLSTRRGADPSQPYLAEIP